MVDSQPNVGRMKRMTQLSIAEASAASEDDRSDASETGRGGPRTPSAPRINIDRIDADAVKVLRRLHRYGHRAYLVGGGVRDLLLNRQPKDFDIATSARPQELRRLFRNCRIIGRRFRLAHILFASGKIIEVATFRRDPTQTSMADDEQDSGMWGIHRGSRRVSDLRMGNAETDLLIRNDNAFGEPHEDAIRRDFTINGLFYDIERGEVIDYVGGLRDLMNRTVRTIGDPDVRFREDPVRILRAIKFSARLDLGIEPEVYDAMVDQRAELGRAARPRLLEEILRLMRGGAAHRSIYLCWDLGVLAELLPEVASFLDDAADSGALWRRLAVIDRWQQAGRLPADSVLLAALLYGPIQEAMTGSRNPSHAFEDFIGEAAMRLAIPRRIKDRVRLMMLAQKRLHATTSGKRGSGKLGSLPRQEYFEDATLLYALDCEAYGRTAPEWALPRGVTGSETVRRRRRRRRRREP